MDDCWCTNAPRNGPPTPPVVVAVDVEEENTMGLAWLADMGAVIAGIAKLPYARGVVATPDDNDDDVDAPK